MKSKEDAWSSGSMEEELLFGGAAGAATGSVGGPFVEDVLFTA